MDRSTFEKVATTIRHLHSGRRPLNSNNIENA